MKPTFNYSQISCQILNAAVNRIADNREIGNGQLLKFKVYQINGGRMIDVEFKMTEIFESKKGKIHFEYITRNTFEIYTPLLDSRNPTLSDKQKSFAVELSLLSIGSSRMLLFSILPEMIKKYGYILPKFLGANHIYDELGRNRVIFEGDFGFPPQSPN